MEDIRERIERVAAIERAKLAPTVTRSRKSTKYFLMILGLLMLVTGLIGIFIEIPFIGELSWVLAGAGLILFISAGVVL